GVTQDARADPEVQAELDVARDERRRSAVRVDHALERREAREALERVAVRADDVEHDGQPQLLRDGELRVHGAILRVPRGPAARVPAELADRDGTEPARVRGEVVERLALV